METLLALVDLLCWSVLAKSGSLDSRGGNKLGQTLAGLSLVYLTFTKLKNGLFTCYRLFF